MNPRLVSIALGALLAGPLTCPPANAQSAKLELSDGIPLVSVRLDGQGPFNFVVDTGTSCEAIISPRLVKRLGLARDGQTRITDLGGHVTRVLDQVSLGTLSLAGADFHAVRAVVTDLPDGDAVFDGILGFRLFRDRLLTLDYPNQKLVMSDGRLAGSLSPGIVAMKMSGGIPMVDLVAGGATIHAAVDSGGLGLSVPLAVARTLQFAGAPETIAMGKTQVSNFALRGGIVSESIALGGHRFEHPFVEVNPVFPIANLGSLAMADFAVTFDQTSKLIQFASPQTVHRLAKPERPGITRGREMIGLLYVKQSSY
jgi:hypothetical protein